MRTLFEMDLNNYKKDGKTFCRPSVRGIIFSNGKIAMIHALKHNYYKFPGGGIEKGESHQETLVREVLEETGLAINKYSIKEYGLVTRKEKGETADIFLQENFYYLCRVNENTGKQNLEDYESEEQFTLEWIGIEQAIKTNELFNREQSQEKKIYELMVQRETLVLKKLLEEKVDYRKERSVVIVNRGEKILLEHLDFGHEFFDLPGGGIDENETPEQAAIRELKEECGLEGRIINKLGIIYCEPSYYDCEHVFHVEVDENAQESIGSDPELPSNEQIIKNVEWKTLDEIPERDRAWLFWRGLLSVPGFKKIVYTWNNQISYPEQN